MYNSLFLLIRNDSDLRDSKLKTSFLSRVFIGSNFKREIRTLTILEF